MVATATLSMWVSKSGKRWSALRSIVPNDQGPTPLDNTVALVINRSTSSGAGGERVILVFCANNTLVWQIHSDDAGHWSAPTGHHHPGEAAG